MGRRSDVPPSRLGRLLLALRESVRKRASLPDADPAFRKKLLKRFPTGGDGISRPEAVSFVSESGGQIDYDYLRDLETGKADNPQPKMLLDLLRAYGLTSAEQEAVLRDPQLNQLAGVNPHLIGDWRLARLAAAEFGPAVKNGLRIDGALSTWVEVEKSGDGGFADDEISVAIDPSPLDVPAAFRKRVDDVVRENARHRERGGRSWTDNPTFALRAVTSQLGSDDHERNHVTLHLQHSSYRYNATAKEDVGAALRWRALQDAAAPLAPVAYLASGIGVAISVACDGGRSLVVGQRSADETFRKGEFDTAVVEGIRHVDIAGEHLALRSVVSRALHEELGIRLLSASEDRRVRRLAVFEFGCDLEYYQWNFLATLTLDVSFDEVVAAWQRAKDRKENEQLYCIPNNREAVLDFVQTHAIWSCGAACLVRALDYADGA